MQTFLPLPDFKASLIVLNDKRLRNQIRETLSLITSINNKSGWYTHPACVMWHNYLPALKHYCNLNIEEVLLRRFKCNVKPFIIDEEIIILPCWLGNREFHSAMRANLLRKDKNYYSCFGWTEQPRDGYYWPCVLIGGKVLNLGYYKNN